MYPIQIVAGGQLRLPRFSQFIPVVSRHHMDMAVKHVLPGRRPVRLDDVDARRAETIAEKHGYSPNRGRNVTRLALRQGEKVFSMSAWDYERMAWSGLLDVEEPDTAVVFVDPPGRRFIRSNGAEDAVGHG